MYCQLKLLNIKQNLPEPVRYLPIDTLSDLLAILCRLPISIKLDLNSAVNYIANKPQHLNQTVLQHTNLNDYSATQYHQVMCSVTSYFYK